MPDETQIGDGQIPYTANTWNLARSIGSDCVEVIEAARATGEDGYDRGVLNEQIEAKAEARDVWPFINADDLLELASDATDIQADNITTDDIALAVSERVRESERYVYIHRPDETDIDLEVGDTTITEETADWQIGGVADDTGTEDDTNDDTTPDPADTQAESADRVDDTTVDDRVEAAHDAVSDADGAGEADDSEKVGADAGNTPSQPTDRVNDDTVEDRVEAAQDGVTESTTEREDGESSEEDSDVVESDVETLSVDEINAGNSTSDTTKPSFGDTSNIGSTGDRTDSSEISQTEAEHDIDATPDAGDSEYDVTQQAEEIATDLYEWAFDETVDLSYTDIMNQHDPRFPKLQTALVEVRNSRGDTKKDRVNDIAGWVQWWIDDPEERIDRADQYAPDPMGKPEV